MDNINTLLKEAEELGILNIDVDSDKLTPEIIQIAIDVTREFNLESDDNIIANKIQEARHLVAAT